MLSIAILYDMNGAIRLLCKDFWNIIYYPIEILKQDTC